MIPPIEPGIELAAIEAFHPSNKSFGGRGDVLLAFVRRSLAELAVVGALGLNAMQKIDALHLAGGLVRWIASAASRKAWAIS